MKSFYADHFGAEHYSPSTLSLFSNCPGMFILSKCFGIKTPVGAAAHRGTSVEHAVLAMLANGASLADGVKLAQDEFNKLMALSTDPNREKEYDALPGLVEEAHKLLSPYGVPSAAQHRVEYRHPDLPLPIIGFTDFEWADRRIVVDLKTQLRLASEIATNHARQGSLYQTALGEGWMAGICYATPKKGHILAIENVPRHMETLVAMAKTLEKFCSVSSDPKELAGLVAPDFDSFYWNETTARREGFKVWGY